MFPRPFKVKFCIYVIVNIIHIISVIIGSYMLCFAKLYEPGAIFQISSHNISHAVNSTHIHIHQEDFD